MDAEAVSALHEAGLTLLSLVRERIRLMDQIEREKAALACASLDADKMAHAVLASDREIRARQDELARERNMTKQSEAELQELSEEIERARDLAEGHQGIQDQAELQSLKDRVRELRHRVDKRFRLGLMSGR